MNASKRSAPGTGITGAPKLGLAQSYAACLHTATLGLIPAPMPMSSARIERLSDELERRGA